MHRITQKKFQSATADRRQGRLLEKNAKRHISVRENLGGVPCNIHSLNEGSVEPVCSLETPYVLMGRPSNFGAEEIRND